MLIPLLLGALAAPPAPEAAGAPPPGPPPIPAPRVTPNNDSRRRRPSLPPWSWRFVGAHYGTGVMASLLVLPGTYALAGWVGHRGKGLSPVVGAMLIGAFLPTPFIYTTQWAVGRRLARRRERFWPGYLVHQVGHLAVFAGSVLGGASFREFRDAAPVVLADAFVVTALSSLTAEATRRPAPPDPTELSWQRHERLWKRAGFGITVPVVKVRF